MMKLARNVVILILVCTAAVELLSTEVHQARFSSAGLQSSCVTDQPQTTLPVPVRSMVQCAAACDRQSGCRDYNFNSETKACTLFFHKPLFSDNTPDCKRYTHDKYVCTDQGPVVPSTIPAPCCSIPFTLNGEVYYNCTDNGGGVGCYHGDRVWKQCQQPTDFEATYVEISTTALSANPSVSIPLLTVNGWILIVRKVSGGSVSFNQNWAAYRDGFGSAAGNDNHWLGLDKVYRLVQMGSARLRIEVKRTDGLWYSCEYSTFSISDEVGMYQITVSGFSGDTVDGMSAPFSGSKFTTFDNDNDNFGGNCAVNKGSGWWFEACTRSNTNTDGIGMWTSAGRVDISRRISGRHLQSYPSETCLEIPGVRSPLFD